MPGIWICSPSGNVWPTASSEPGRRDPRQLPRPGPRLPRPRQPIRQRLADRFDLVDGLVHGAGPARYLQSTDGRFSVGFITPISRHFCATCNRVRLAVDGTLYLCLGQNDNYAFRPLLREGASDEQLIAAVLEAIARKPERHDFLEQPGKIARFMNVTGG